jgi:hypothetical protein
MRSNKTHESKSDPDARLLRKGKGKESMLCHISHVIVDSATGLIRACKVTKAWGLGGNAEVVAALELAEEHLKPDQILLADRGGFVEGVRGVRIRAHPRAKDKISVLDPRLTSKTSFKESLKRRFIVQQPFAWIKGPGRMRQTTFKGTERVSWQFHPYALAYNLTKMAKLA